MTTDLRGLTLIHIRGNAYVQLRGFTLTHIRGNSIGTDQTRPDRQTTHFNFSRIDKPIGASPRRDEDGMYYFSM